MEHSAGTELDLLARAEAVSHLGEYIGAFELGVWGARRRRRVLLLVGDTITDMMTMFAPHTVHWIEPGAVVHFVACKFVDGILVSADRPGLLPDFNHYVIGMPLAGRLDHISAFGLRAGSEDLHVSALRVGWAIVPTQVFGDCGIDVMCFFDGLPRTPANFKKIRNELQEAIEGFSTDVYWRTTFAACCETPLTPALPPLPPPMGSPASAADISDEELHLECDLPPVSAPGSPLPAVPASGALSSGLLTDSMASGPSSVASAFAPSVMSVSSPSTSAPVPSSTTSDHP